jgi:hypothetical protein
MLFALSALSACAFPFAFRPNAGVTRYMAALPAPTSQDAVAPDSAAVELRSYRHSPHVEIVSWTTDDWAFGLRARLRRDGSLVRDHRLYVSTYSSVAAGSRINSALTPTRPLRLTGVSRDDRACAGGKSCLPVETFGVRIPDDLLRSNRDSLPVTFHARDGHELMVTLQRDLINTYLAAVDSVSLSLRKK